MTHSSSSGPAGIPSPEALSPVEETPKRRVLMLINRLGRGGGGERAMVALAAGLPRDRYEVTVVTTRRESGPLLEVLRSHDVRHFSLQRRGRFDVVPFARLVALLHAERIDVLHAHMFGSNFWGSVLGRLAGVPVVVAQEQTWSYQGKPIRRFVDGHVIGPLVDAFVAVSERDRDRMVSIEGVAREKIVVLPNPYVRRPPGEPVDLRSSLGILESVPLVATVAVHRAQKALDVLLQAFAELLTEIPDAMLVIGGDGPRRQSLQDLSRDLGISDRVSFLGWCEDVGSVLEAADVAAMSSDFEGSPLFALECMAHMTPLVSTDVGNVAQILVDGEGVVIVPPRDPSAMARALTGLLRDPQRRAAQASAAAAHLPRYELESVTAEFSGLYDRLLAVHSRPCHRPTRVGASLRKLARRSRDRSVNT